VSHRVDERPVPGDWFAFAVDDRRWAAARIGSVSRDGRVFVGWFFGPFDGPPDAGALLRRRREDALWPVLF
jgi:hypothetical protein